MASTKKKIVEQILRRLKSGDPSVGSNIHEMEVKEAVMQVLNSRLRAQYFEGMGVGENIPDGCIITTYDNVPVVSWNGVSKSTLPAIPVSLPKNMGVWRITPVPYTSAQLAAPTITATAVSDTQINVVVGSVLNATSYSLERSTDLNNWATISNAAGTFNDTGRTANTTYYYRVKAIGNGTTYTDSNYKYATAKTDTTPQQKLSTPVLTLSNATNNGFDIAWTQDVHADGAVLERSLFADFHIIQESLPLSGSGAGAWGYSGLSSGTTYYVRVKVTDSTTTYLDSDYASSNITTL